jgi:hypothetical protein
MLAEQVGSVVYVSATTGLYLMGGRLVLSLREARQLRDALVNMAYQLGDDEGDPEDG